MGSEGDIALVMEDDEFEKHELDDDILEYSGLTKTSEIFSDSSEMDEQTDLRIWLFRLLNDAALEQYKDVEFVINSDGQDRVVKAHRLILTTRSRTFAVILDKEPDHKTPVRINDVAPEVFESLLNYVYTGQIPHPKRVVATVNLLQAAKLYDIQPLYNATRQFLSCRLAHFSTKHFIMIMQRVLDLKLKDLEKECMKILEENTDAIVMHPLFLRVSSKFVSKLLELDTFGGISEATVFTRILEWAELRVPGHNDDTVLLQETKKPSKFKLQKPDVRKVLDPFFYDFRLISIPREDLAGLVRNSGVFTEREQLVVSYYLLDQTKTFGDFNMRERKMRPESAPNAKVSSKPSDSSSHSSAGSRKTAKSMEAVVQLHDEVSITSSKVEENHVEESLMEVPAVRKRSHGVPHSVSEANVKETTENPTLVEMFRHKFAMDKKKTSESQFYDTKTKKDDKMKAKNNKDSDKSVGITKTPEKLPVIQSDSLTKAMTVKMDSKESDSYGSQSSISALNTPASESKIQPGTVDDSVLTVTKRKNSKTKSERPKSVLVDQDSSVAAEQQKDWGSVGKKHAVRSGLSGLMSKTMKWAPDRQPEYEKPKVPPRVKGAGNGQASGDVITEI